MAKRKEKPRFLLCVKNAGYAVSLEVRKLYQVLADEKAAAHRYVRVIDESGEDYLYPAEFFIQIELPQATVSKLVRAS